MKLLLDSTREIIDYIYEDWDGIRFYLLLAVIHMVTWSGLACMWLIIIYNILK